MSNVKLPYNITNNLDSFIIREVGSRMAKTGIKVNKKDIMNEIANYCGVGFENINRIKRGISQPSLGVALKMAEYFGEKVEDIFEISLDKIK